MNILIVLGSESSGTRLAQTIFAALTGWRTDDSESERWWRGGEITPPVANSSFGTVELTLPSRVTRRSLPHGALNFGRMFYPPLAFADRAAAAGYTVRFLLTTRDVSIMARSKARTHLAGDMERARQEIRDAHRFMAEVIASPYHSVLFNYETLLALRTHYVGAVARQLRLSWPRDFILPCVLEDGNVKYFKGQR